VTPLDHFENEIREILLMARDHRHDGYVREGLKKKLERIRDLISEELKKI
jgi:hypothetical protein